MFEPLRSYWFYNAVAGEDEVIDAAYHRYKEVFSRKRDEYASRYLPHERDHDTTDSVVLLGEDRYDVISRSGVVKSCKSRLKIDDQSIQHVDELN